MSQLNRRVWSNGQAYSVSQRMWNGTTAKEVIPQAFGGTAPASGASYGVFYAMPDDIRTHTKKVWAHYFGPYPRSLNNEATAATTEYATYFNSPYKVTSNPDNSTFGSYFRDAPLFRAQSASTQWQIDDCKFDIDSAMAAGIDGFMCDLLGLSGSNYNNYGYLQQALRQLRAVDPKYNSFYVIPQIDANGATAQASTSTAGGYVAKFNDTSYHLPTGEMLWSCFLVESPNVSLSWWEGVASYLTGQNIPNVFVGVANNWNASPNYDAVQYGAGSWGFGADPGCNNAASNQASAAHARGKIYMHPATSQDTRPRNQLFDESCNTEALRATWNKAISQATGSTDMVLVVTWSDFSEAPMAPSMQKGFCYLDLTGYYAIAWKTGSFPTILKDQIYLSHRDELFGSVQTAATLTGPETLPMQHWSKTGATSPRNMVEVLTFLTAPADITVTVGGVPTTYTAPAGMNAHLIPLAVGAAPSAVAKRSGVTVASVTSVVAVSNSVVADDAGYYCVTSGDRGTAGQMRANMT